MQLVEFRVFLLSFSIGRDSSVVKDIDVKECEPDSHAQRGQLKERLLDQVSEDVIILFRKRTSSEALLGDQDATTRSVHNRNNPTESMAQPGFPLVHHDVEGNQ